MGLSSGKKIVLVEQMERQRFRCSFYLIFAPITTNLSRSVQSISNAAPLSAPFAIVAYLFERIRLQELDLQ